MMARPTRTTDYRCTNGHTFYSWANTPVTIRCAECGDPFVRVTRAGVPPVVCGPRCRNDRQLRLARAAARRRVAS